MFRSIVTSTLLYASETWTLTAEDERRIQTFQMRCYRKIIGISPRDRTTNEDVKNMVRAAIGPHDNLLSIKSQDQETEMVRTCYTSNRTCKDHHTGHSTRREETRQAKEMLARQHQGRDGDPETSRGQRRLEENHLWFPYSPPPPPPPPPQQIRGE